MYRTCILWIGLIACLLTACGGSGSGTAADAESVDLEASIESDGWQVRLAALPEKHLILGKGNITYQAEGGNIYLVVFVDMSNTSATLKVMARDLLLVRDGAETCLLYTSPSPRD